jgi:hypothetical protein
LLVYLTDIGRNITATEVTTPVVPFKNKIQYYQRKRSFLITSLKWKIEYIFSNPLEWFYHVTEQQRNLIRSEAITNL